MSLFPSEAEAAAGGSSAASALCPECKSSLLQTPKTNANVMFVSPKGWSSKRTDDGYILQDSNHKDALRVNIRKGELKSMMAQLKRKTKLIRASGKRDTRYDRETQAPLVWLHLNENHGKFLATESGAGSDSVVDLFIEQGPTGNGKFLRSNADAMLKRAYGAFETSFPHHLYGEFLQNLDVDLERYANTSASTAYATVAGQTRCKQAAVSQGALAALATRRVQPVDGGASLPVMGMDVAGSVLARLHKANGPAAAQAPAVGLLAKAALMQLKGVLQTAIAVAVTDIPPAIPPPAWNNMPFPCMPMVTGHNCFGAVQYPITIGDFVLADVSDSALDGVIASFPAYYRSHVGTTDGLTPVWYSRVNN